MGLCYSILRCGILDTSCYSCSNFCKYHTVSLVVELLEIDSKWITLSAGSDLHLLDVGYPAGHVQAGPRKVSVGPRQFVNDAAFTTCFCHRA